MAEPATRSTPGRSQPPARGDRPPVSERVVERRNAVLTTSPRTSRRCAAPCVRDRARAAPRTGSIFPAASCRVRPGASISRASTWRVVAAMEEAQLYEGRPSSTPRPRTASLSGSSPPASPRRRRVGARRGRPPHRRRDQMTAGVHDAHHAVDGSGCAVAKPNGRWGRARTVVHVNHAGEEDLKPCAERRSCRGRGAVMMS